MDKTQIFTVEDARNKAITWQQWQADKSLSYKEFMEWERYFTRLGIEFNLTEEFKENGII